MATAYFLNSSPFRIALNLNSEFDNHTLGPKSFANPNDTALELAVWPAPVRSFRDRGVFGGGDSKNTLVVFSEGSAEPQVYEIRSTVSTALNLYIYVLGEQVTGAAQTGSIQGITVSAASAEVAAAALRSVPAPPFPLPSA